MAKKKETESMSEKMGLDIEQLTKITFYKAFAQLHDEVDMMIDTSGDTFSMSPEGAIIDLYTNMRVDDIFRFPTLVAFINGEEIENGCKDLLEKSIVTVVAFTPHDKTEFMPAILDGDPFNDPTFILARNRIKEGLQMDLAEYEVDRFSIVSRKKDMVERQVKSLHAINRSLSDNPRLPKIIEVDNGKTISDRIKD